MREEFIKQVVEVLIGYGFSRSEGDEWEYKLIQTFTQPGQQMVINGQAFQQPPQEIEVVHIIKDMGDGYYENVDGSNRVDLTQFEFQAWMKNEIRGQLFSSYAWDDIGGFKKDLQNIVKV